MSQWRRWRGLFAGFSFLVLAATIYATADPRPQRLWAEQTLIEVWSPIQGAGTGLANTARGVVTAVTDLVRLRRENRELRAQVQRLTMERQELLELARENAALREMLRLTRQAPYTLVTAEVVARPAGNWFSTLTVNKGRLAGVNPGMAVIAPEGVVGHVTGVTSHSATVLLIVDPRSAVGGLDTLSSSLVLVQGTQDPTGKTARVQPLAQDARLEPGDEIVTSGLGEIFPKGLKVGAVEKVRAGKYGLSQVGVLRTAVDFDRLEWVSIIVRH